MKKARGPRRNSPCAATADSGAQSSIRMVQRAGPGLSFPSRSCKMRDRSRGTESLALPGRPDFKFHGARSQSLWAGDDLIRQANQVEPRELRSWAFICVVIKHLNACFLERSVNFGADLICQWIARLKIGEPSSKRRDGLWPNYAGFVMMSFDERAHEPRNPDPVRATLKWPVDSVGAGDEGPHRP